MKQAYIILFVIILIMNFAESGSMTRYLERCNHNNSCDVNEDSDTCPEDCPVNENKKIEVQNASSMENDIPKTNRDSQFVIKNKNQFPTKHIFSIGFVALFIILVILLYFWIYRKTNGLRQNKDNLEKEKQMLYPKPKRKL